MRLLSDSKKTQPKIENRTENQQCSGAHDARFDSDIEITVVEDFAARFGSHIESKARLRKSTEDLTTRRRRNACETRCTTSKKAPVVFGSDECINGDKLGVRRRIFRLIRLVHADRNDFATTRDHAADRHLALLERNRSQPQRFAHELAILFRERHLRLLRLRRRRR
jgi:hypothetical protein